MKSRNIFYLSLFTTIAVIAGNRSAQAQKQIFQPNFASLEKSNPVPEWFKDNRGVHIGKMIFEELK